MGSRERVRHVTIAGEIERLKRAVAQISAIGGDAGWLGKMIEARLAELHDEKRRRRDAAIVDLAQTFDGSAWARARAAARAWKRYAAANWAQRDCRLAAPPLEYSRNPEKLALFAIMREGGAALGPKQISNVCRAADGNPIPLPISIHPELDCRHEPQPGAENMNFALPKSDLALLEAVRNSPVGKQTAASLAKAATSSRQQMVAEIEALDAQAAIDFPRHDKAIAAAVAGVRAAELALREANSQLSAANYAKSQMSIAYTLARGRLEEALRDGADGGAIDAFISQMLDGMETARKNAVGGYDYETNPVTRKTTMRGYSNSKSVFARIDAMKRAIERAEQLRLAPDQSDVGAKLAELKAALPPIGEPVFATASAQA